MRFRRRLSAIGDQVDVNKDKRFCTEWLPFDIHKVDIIVIDLMHFTVD